MFGKGFISEVAIIYAETRLGMETGRPSDVGTPNITVIRDVDKISKGVHGWLG